MSGDLVQLVCAPIPPKETLKERKKFFFKKPFKLSSLSFKRNWKEGEVICLPPNPQRKSRSRQRPGTYSEEGTAQEGGLLPPL